MQMMVRSKVKPDQVERNLELLRASFAELESLRPEGLRMATFQLDDGVTFVGIVELDGGPGMLHALPAFQRYRSTLDERCEEPVVVTMLQEVGSYRFG
jgi:hypothetical protein